ncbi:MAG: sulfite exporter TauE/SafE family protein [Candidatus Korarchaeota archaeon NZ13-K]|nr:MAG: sulfite exporter TauE/SafE family protein [Candidatus Korarchaeota archaeon NZ13-K]
MLREIALLLTGLAGGIVGGLLGTGGCVIMLPALAFLFGYRLPVAIGTTITAVIITASSGAVGHIRIGNVDYKTAKVIAISGAVGAAVGSLIFILLAGNTSILSLILGLAFLYVSIRMIYEGSRRSMGAGEGKEIPGSGARKGILGFLIGVLTGIVGLGGGYALVPSFIYILGAPVKLAVGTSLASFISMALVSGAFKLAQGYVDLIAALLLGVGTAFGAQIGARLVPKLPAWAIKLLFGLVFLYVSLKFILTPLGIRI